MRLKYTPENGKITLTAKPRTRIESREGLYDVICVIDDGTGLTESELQNLFKAENISSTPGTNDEKGSGLGLILCREFIELHQGLIWAESEVGKGSKFSFALPSIK